MDVKIKNFIKFLVLKQTIILQLFLLSFVKHKTQPVSKIFNVTKILCHNQIFIIME